jgi:hypothetical protein
VTRAFFLPVGDTAMIIHTTTLLLFVFTVVLLSMLRILGMWALMAEAACGFSWANGGHGKRKR